MGKLEWDEIDLIELTESIPETEEYEVAHHFDFDRGASKCQLNIWQLESFIEISILDSVSQLEVCKIAFYCRSTCAVKLTDNAIVFSDCVFTKNRFSYVENGNIYEKNVMPYGNTVMLYIYKDSLNLKVQ